MIKKKLVQLFLIVYLASNLILSVSCPISDEWTIGPEWTVSGEFSGGGPGATQGTYHIYTNSLGIQQGYSTSGQTNWILLTATTNMINSSTNTLMMSPVSGSGYLTFLSNETFNLKVDFDFNTVRLQGDQGNVPRLISNGSTHDVNAGNTVTVSWVIILEPIIPYMFILGMIGLGSMFVGPIVTIKTVKENPRQAVTMGVTLTALGIGLFMAWLGSG